MIMLIQETTRKVYVFVVGFFTGGGRTSGCAEQYAYEELITVEPKKVSSC
jgi:hypothetical protein